MFEEKRISELIMKAYWEVFNGLKRMDLETDVYSIKAYKAGDIIRIDIKRKSD